MWETEGGIAKEGSVVYSIVTKLRCLWGGSKGLLAP